MHKPGSLKRTYAVERTIASKMEERPRSRKEYHSRRWTEQSRIFRDAKPICARCEAKGILSPTEVTDHVIPVEIYGNFWDRSNWQPLCKRCNIEKGNEDKKIINEYRKANQ